MRVDSAIFHFFNNFSGHYKALDWLGIFFAQYSQYALVLLLLTFFFWAVLDGAKKRQAILLGFAAAIFARYIVKSIILLVDERARPFVVFPDVHPLIATAVSENFQSFPSGHAIFFFALSTVLFRYHRKLGSWFFAASAVMGIARVFVGVHWPSDIVAGAVLGIVIGFLADESYARIKNRLEKNSAVG